MRVMTNQVITVADGHVTGQMTAENLARDKMKTRRATSTSCDSLRETYNGASVYHWGDQELVVASHSSLPETLIELLSTDIILFKRHPEAISARNLLKATIVRIFDAGSRVGVEPNAEGAVSGRNYKRSGQRPGNQGRS